ncbi:hypothetical protein CONLIGDRAFT_648585 [Coniochaeta ligniaria NRRL 30616]|uniref:Uncharacterized protein n=1 Tax=Coniochaeta ligniaria NRRL 30616 TaxID=1408157 RepID=A0A1J7J3M2_9PEZI|nr:hypothetical protein CONLIGDRAFT_648585 [Coniochaeta ligniaria NRRL 30616]
MHKPTFLITFVAALLVSATPFRVSPRDGEPASRSDGDFGHGLAVRGSPPPGKSLLHLWDRLSTNFYLAIAANIIINIIAVQFQGNDFPMDPRYHLDRNAQIRGAIAQASQHLDTNAPTQVVNQAFGQLVISLSNTIPHGRNPDVDEWDVLLTSAYHRLEAATSRADRIDVNLDIEGYGTVTMTIKTTF